MRLYRSKKVRISNKHWGVASKKWCVVNCSQQHCRTVPFHTQCLTQIETVQRIAVRGLWRLMPKKLTSCLKHPKTSWTMLDHGRGSLHAKSAHQHNVQIHRFDPTCPQHVLSVTGICPCGIWWQRKAFPVQFDSDSDIFIRIGLFQYLFDSFCMFWDQKSNILLNFEKSSLTCTVCI